MVVAVDKITESLKQTIIYLNDHLDGSVLALELAYSRDGEIEILIPAVYGAESAERKERARRPTVADADTVVVAARDAYQIYLDTGAYACQPGRRFRDEVKYLGFYKSKAIQREVPIIRHRRDNVIFSREEARRLRTSTDEAEARVGELIDALLAAGSYASGKAYQVFLLSGPPEEGTLVLPHPVRHARRGAWTQGQRYTSSEALKRAPSTTDDLLAEGG